VSGFPSSMKVRSVRLTPMYGNAGGVASFSAALHNNEYTSDISVMSTNLYSL
jgi:hypothetical protein